MQAALTIILKFSFIATTKTSSSQSSSPSSSAPNTPTAGPAHGLVLYEEFI